MCRKEKIPKPSFVYWNEVPGSEDVMQKPKGVKKVNLGCFFIDLFTF